MNLEMELLCNFSIHSYRRQVEERLQEEMTKLRISAEQEESMLRQKQQKQQSQRCMERERENGHHERKYTRINAMKEKKKRYNRGEEERNEIPTTRDQKVQVYKFNLIQF